MPFFLFDGAHQPPKFELTIESIMRGPALVGHAPRGLRWTPDGAKVTFSWAKADGSPDPGYKNYTINRDGTGLVSGSPPSGGGESNPWDFGNRQGDKIAYASGGDIFIYDTVKKSPEQITTTPEREDNPRLTPDGTKIVFTRDGNLFRLELSDKSIKQLTEFKTDAPAPAGSNTFPVAIRVPAGMRRGTLTPSPAGTHASLDLTQPVTGTVFAGVPNYITNDNLPRMISTYDRVGQPQTTSRGVIYDLETGAAIDFAGARPGRLSQIRWSPDGKHAIAWSFAEDHKDAWLLGFDTATDKVSVLWDEHSDAWVGGPGRGLLAWLPDGSRFYFESEQNGFANLYTMAPGDPSPKDLTPGQFEVDSVRLDLERNRFIYVSSEGSPFKRHIDAIGFDGTNHQKLAEYSADEDATFAIAPNGKDIAVVRSKSNRPAELYVNDVQVTNTPTDEWLSGPWIDPPVVMVPAKDGTPVPARLFKPKKWKKGGPAVVFIHGAGYLQNVYDGWSHYFREYMFHHVLMDRGYAVMDIDYRGSAGYGRAWRTAIYRHMGGKDLDDAVDGAKYLVKEVGVARDRIGIYGGSYGGFLTLMAMFTAPDTFAAGAALRPVADWASYNHGYTSEILNTPSTDPEAYRQSSPINFVDGLKGSLLICHGMVDTNVTFQDSVRVAEKLIELGKTNWSIAPYPVENHAFDRPASWTDEYRRIFDLFDRTIGAHRVKSKL